MYTRARGREAKKFSGREPLTHRVTAQFRHFFGENP